MNAPSSPPRLPVLRPTALDPAQTALYQSIVGGRRAGGPVPLVAEDGALLGPFNALLHGPAVGSAVQELGVALRFSAGLAGREREIAILAVAQRECSEYELYAHRLIAASTGLSEREIASLADGRRPEGLTAREHAVHDVAVALLERGDLAEEEYAEAYSSLGAEGLVVLTALVGYYRMLALQLRVFRVEAPPAGP